MEHLPRRNHSPAATALSALPWAVAGALCLLGAFGSARADDGCGPEGCPGAPTVLFDLIGLPATFEPGQEVDLSLRYALSGADLQELALSVPLPPGVVPTGGVADGGWSGGCQPVEIDPDTGDFARWDCLWTASSLEVSQGGVSGQIGLSVAFMPFSFVDGQEVSLEAALTARWDDGGTSRPIGPVASGGTSVAFASALFERSAYFWLPEGGGFIRVETPDGPTVGRLANLQLDLAAEGQLPLEAGATLSLALPAGVSVVRYDEWMLEPVGDFAPGTAGSVAFALRRPIGEGGWWWDDPWARTFASRGWGLGFEVLIACDALPVPEGQIATLTVEGLVPTLNGGSEVLITTVAELPVELSDPNGGWTCEGDLRSALWTWQIARSANAQVSYGLFPPGGVVPSPSTFASTRIPEGLRLAWFSTSLPEAAIEAHGFQAWACVLPDREAPLTRADFDGGLRDSEACDRVDPQQGLDLSARTYDHTVAVADDAWVLDTPLGQAVLTPLSLSHQLFTRQCMEGQGSTVETVRHRVELGAEVVDREDALLFDIFSRQQPWASAPQVAGRGQVTTVEVSLVNWSGSTLAPLRNPTFLVTLPEGVSLLGVRLGSPHGPEDPCVSPTPTWTLDGRELHIALGDPDDPWYSDPFCWNNGCAQGGTASLVLDVLFQPSWPFATGDEANFVLLVDGDNFHPDYALDTGLRTTGTTVRLQVAGEMRLDLGPGCDADGRTSLTTRFVNSGGVPLSDVVVDVPMPRQGDGSGTEVDPTLFAAVTSLGQVLCSDDGETFTETCGPDARVVRVAVAELAPYESGELEMVFALEGAFPEGSLVRHTASMRSAELLPIDAPPGAPARWNRCPGLLDIGMWFVSDPEAPLGAPEPPGLPAWQVRFTDPTPTAAGELLSFSVRGPRSAVTELRLPPGLLEVEVLPPAPQDGEASWVILTEPVETVLIETGVTRAFRLAVSCACDDDNPCTVGSCAEGGVCAWTELTTPECVQECGDGYVDEGEQCDVGVLGELVDGCLDCACGEGHSPDPGGTGCVIVCGDGIVGGDEECDDGGESETCGADCRFKCGNGVVDEGEDCDVGPPGVAASNCESCQCDFGYVPDPASSGCVSFCGDGIVAGDEECDDGGESETCGADCRLKCGNGVVDEGEECDTGLFIDLTGGCIECECAFIGWFYDADAGGCRPRCGDNLVMGDEECDDGNTVSGDGCSADCRIEETWECAGPSYDTCLPRELCDGELPEWCRLSGDGGSGAGDWCWFLFSGEAGEDGDFCAFGDLGCQEPAPECDSSDPTAAGEPDFDDVEVFVQPLFAPCFETGGGRVRGVGYVFGLDTGEGDPRLDLLADMALEVGGGAGQPAWQAEALGGVTALDPETEAEVDFDFLMPAARIGPSAALVLLVKRQAPGAEGEGELGGIAALRLGVATLDAGQGWGDVRVLPMPAGLYFTPRFTFPEAFDGEHLFVEVAGEDGEAWVIYPRDLAAPTGFGAPVAVDPPEPFEADDLRLIATRDGHALWEIADPYGYGDPNDVALLGGAASDGWALRPLSIPDGLVVTEAESGLYAGLELVPRSTFRRDEDAIELVHGGRVLIRAQAVDPEGLEPDWELLVQLTHEGGVWTAGLHAIYRSLPEQVGLLELAFSAVEVYRDHYTFTTAGGDPAQMGQIYRRGPGGDERWGSYPTSLGAGVPLRQLAIRGLIERPDLPTLALYAFIPEGEAHERLEVGALLGEVDPDTGLGVVTPVLVLDDGSGGLASSELDFAAGHGEEVILGLLTRRDGAAEEDERLWRLFVPAEGPASAIPVRVEGTPLLGLEFAPPDELGLYPFDAVGGGTVASIPGGCNSLADLVGAIAQEDLFMVQVATLDLSVPPEPPGDGALSTYTPTVLSLSAANEEAIEEAARQAFLGEARCFLRALFCDFCTTLGPSTCAQSCEVTGCETDNPCLVGICDPATGCSFEPVPDGSACDDGDLCTVDGVCAAGECAPGEAVDCGAPGPCQEAVVCDGQSGACVPVAAPDGEVCGEASACFGPSRCGGGECLLGPPVAGECRCGDTWITAGEACDDGNTVSGDGCDASCQVEDGWYCFGLEPPPGQANPGGFCLRFCGNGILDNDEECDDGNRTSGDGCSSDCTIEPGFRCDTPSVLCRPVCGDGIVVPPEQCDDGNPFGGDGCSPDCRVEPGWECPSGTACHPVCGDGRLSGGQTCDDGNRTGGDGCSADCQVEPGWVCPVPSMPCVRAEADDAEVEALDDAAETFAGRPVSIDVLLNDRGRDLRVVELGAAQAGQARLVDAFTVVYAPEEGFSGVDAFTYVVEGAGGQRGSATVTVTVRPAPATPFEILSVDQTCDGAAGTYGLEVLLAGGSGRYLLDGRPVTSRFTVEGILGVPGSWEVADAVTDTARHIEGGVDCEVPPKSLRALSETVTAEEGVVHVDILANEGRPGLRVVAIDAVQPPDAGALVRGSTEGRYTFIPNPGFAGELALSYRVADPSGVEDGATLIIRVPLGGGAVRDDKAVTRVGVPVTLDVLRNDLGDGERVAFTQGEAGQVHEDGEGRLVYTPAPGFEGVDTFTYTVAFDGFEAEATVWITVLAEDRCATVRVDEPVATCAPVGSPEAQGPSRLQVAIPLRSDSGQPEVQSLPGEVISFTGARHGPGAPEPLPAPVLRGDVFPPRGADATFTPVEVASGESLRLLALDSVAGEISSRGAPAGVSVSVDCDDTTPIEAVDDLALTRAGVPVLLRPLDNDRGVGLSTVSVSRPAHGTLEGLGLGVHRYVPEPGFTGLERLAYTIRDAHGAMDGGLIDIHVEAHPPGICADFAITDLEPECGQDGTLRWAFRVQGGSGAFEVDGDFTLDRAHLSRPLPSGELMQLEVVDAGAPDCGRLTVLGQHTCPGPLPAIAARPDRVVVPAGGSAPLSPLDNDVGEGLVIVAMGRPEHGSVAAGSGGWVYVAAAGFTGVDTATYTIADSAGRTTSGRIVFFVNPPGIAPEGCASCATEARDDRVRLSAGGLLHLDPLANDSGPGLQRVGLSGYTSAEVSVEAGGLSLRGGAESPRSERLTYRIRDSFGLEDEAVILITTGPALGCEADAGALVAASLFACGGELVATGHAQGPGYGVGVVVTDAAGLVVAFDPGARLQRQLPAGTWSVASYSWRLDAGGSLPQEGQPLSAATRDCADLSAPVAYRELEPIGILAEPYCTGGGGYGLDLVATGGEPALGAPGLAFYTTELSALPPYTPGQVLFVTVRDDAGCERTEIITLPNAPCGGVP